MTALPGVGAHRPDPYRGWLVFDSLPPEIQRAEDATHAADVDLANRDWRRWRFRPATDAERMLLAHLGYDVPADLQTRVEWRHGSLRQRRWPALETTTTTTTHTNNSED